MGPARVSHAAVQLDAASRRRRVCQLWGAKFGGPFVCFEELSFCTGNGRRGRSFKKPRKPRLAFLSRFLHRKRKEG